MLRLRAGTATLLIGPRASAGVHGSLYCLDSETDIRQRLTLSLQDPASREAIRRFWAHWQSDARLAGVKDQSIVDRIAHMGVRGPLIVLLVTDTSVNRRDSSASRSKQVAEAQQNQVQFKPYDGPVKSPTLVTVSAVTPAAAKTQAPVDRSVIAAPTKAIGDWTIAEKLTAIVTRAADSRRLSLDTQQQLKGMLSDPKFIAWLVGSLLVWFVAQFFVVGEIFDMLLAGAALILSGAGIFFALQSLVGAAHLIGQFVEATRNAKDDKDLDAAADILANIIVMIGITVLIAALTHATSRATSEGKPASTIKKPPPERTAPVEKTVERPAPKQEAKSTTESKKSTAEPQKPGLSNGPSLRSDLDPKWLKDDGTPKWPANDGFESAPTNETLPVGTKLDRYGGDGGSFMSPEGTPYENRALPYDQSTLKYQQYEVIKPLPVKSGEAAPWFDQPGGGTQHNTDVPVRQLVKDGYLRKI
jgi:Tuberculosis necrotizing toxin